MKASALIGKLENLIQEFGDLDVISFDDWNEPAQIFDVTPITKEPKRAANPGENAFRFEIVLDD